MRKLMILVTVLAMAALVGACADDDNPSGPSGLDAGTMEATVDGNSWSASNATFFGGTVSATQGTPPSSGSTITINVGSDPEVGSDNGSCIYAEINGIADQEQWTSSDGSFDITKVTDDEVQGTFEFTGSNGDGDEKSISGSFRANVQSNPFD